MGHLKIRHFGFSILTAVIIFFEKWKLDDIYHPVYYLNIFVENFETTQNILNIFFKETIFACSYEHARHIRVKSNPARTEQFSQPVSLLGGKKYPVTSPIEEGERVATRPDSELNKSCLRADHPVRSKTPPSP